MHRQTINNTIRKVEATSKQFSNKIMKSIDFKPLLNTVVVMKQIKRGDCKRFISYMLMKRYHCFEFELNHYDARDLFNEMKKIAKYNPSKAHYSSNHGNWFIQIMAGSDPVLCKRDGKYILQVNSCGI